jgi:hypothetical protein
MRQTSYTAAVPLTLAAFVKLLLLLTFHIQQGRPLWAQAALGRFTTSETM